MKIFNKCMAIALTAILLLTLLPSVSASPALDAAGAAIEKMQAFGIITADDRALLESDAPLSRGAFTRLMVLLSGVAPASAAGGQGKLPFGDVTSADKNYPYLCAAYEMGLVNGASNDLFRPDDPVTSEMAAKMLVTVIGYKPLAELRGGYPTGYQIVASQLKLFSGCENQAELNGAAAAILMENALEAPYFRATEIGIGYETFQSNTDDTLLQERFLIYQTKGVLSGTENTALLSGSSRLKHGFVTIDQTRYAVGDTAAAEWLGYAVEAYWRGEPGEDGTLVYIAPQQKNETLQIDTENILSANAERLSYVTDDGKTKTLKISLHASFIYNGKQTPFSSDLLQAEYGALTLIDNDGDGVYDVLLMRAYRTIVVSSAMPSTHTVADYLDGKTVELDPNVSDYRVYLTLDGAPVTVADLQPWDVLSYTESLEDGTVVKTALVHREKATGMVTAVSPGDTMAEINGVEYQVSAAMMKKINAGQEGSFYIDAFGRIVAASGERDVVYGYVKAGLKKGMDKYLLKIFTENNRWVELPLREKLQFNGVSGTSAADAYSALLAGEAVKPQLITYRVSTEREINELSTAQNIPVGSAGEQAAIEAGTFRKSLSISSANYRNYSGSAAFGDVVCVALAKVFVLPENPASASDNMFYAGSAALLTHDTRYSNIVAFDVDDMRYAHACTIDRKAGGTENNIFMVVTKINTAVDDYGDTVYALHGLYQGSQSTVYTANTEMVDAISLKKGDVVQFGVDENGKVRSLSRSWNTADGFRQKGISGDPYSPLAIVRGQVKNISLEKGGIVLDYGSGQGIYRIGASPVYLYDPVRGRGMVGTSGDIAVGDYVFFAEKYLTGGTIVVFKEY